MHPYLPILLILLIALFIGIVMSALAHFLGPRNPSTAKEENFECGVPIVSNKEKISVKFYLTAILFILFDIETIFLYLWAKVFTTLGWFGVIEILVFMFILIVGYVFVLKTNALEWD
jgi:NADH-quinone oxidoreductase subunit A